MRKFKNSCESVITEKFMLIVPAYLTILEDVAEEIYAAEAIRCNDIPDIDGWQTLYTIYWRDREKINLKLPDKICDYGIKYNITTGQFIES